mgnify:FL=1
MKRAFFLSLCVLLASVRSWAGSLQDIRQSLQRGAVSQLQEKVYVHTDNTCYFVGDTLWYKAYVTRADTHQPTDMSRILYVELLSPDGLLVERQQIIVSAKGYTCGQFALRDSLYSGYYELRAYTRWMLNFNVVHQRYSRHDTWHFYNKQMAADYFRQWEGLYSRVLPVYSKPEVPGDYDVRRMYQRPKTRIPQRKKDNLLVTFYPEGGHLIDGVENWIAFDATDQNGEAVNVKGTVTASGMPAVTIQAEHDGRGAFRVTPSGKPMHAKFMFRGKEYSFPLPKAEAEGVSLHVEDGRLSLNASRLPANGEYAVSVLCRGALQQFVPIDSCPNTLTGLPSGINEITVFDADGRIWASRLFFVNNHENDSALITAPINPRKTYAPYERIEIPVTVSRVSQPTVFSLSIRDTGTDEPSYYDGNIMTDMLLSGDLRGFVAHPAYYFEKDDAAHRRHLDHLLMVQGWRKYKWEEIADTTLQMRYQPEKNMTVSGAVYKMLDVRQVEPDEVVSWQQNQAAAGSKIADDAVDDDPFGNDDDGNVFSSTEEITLETATDNGGTEYTTLGQANDNLGVNHSGLRREVLVEAELIMGRETVAAVQTTQRGRFLFDIPPFYGATYLNLKAYTKGDSIKKNMLSRKDADVFKETAYPDFYVKRDMPFPTGTSDYSFYQRNAPEWQVTIDEDSLSELSMENEVHELRNVNVRGHRRGRRAVDWTKPAYVYDAYDTYNDLTDYGLSFGYYDMRSFPFQVATFLYGNMHRYNTFHVDGRLNGITYWRNYSPLDSHATDVEHAGLFSANRTSQELYKDLLMARLQNIRVFSDYEPRRADSTMVEELHSADATVEMVNISDDGKQVVYRDRHIFLRGFNEAAAFYHPDYSSRQPGQPADYRRTLYWNPNAVTDDEGRFTAVFFNNGKDTRIKMSAAGVTSDGLLLHSE